MIGATDITPDILKLLDQQIETWEMLNVPALLERFVRRNGKWFAPVKRIGTKREPKACFSNATTFVQKRGGKYVEGYVLNKKLPWLFHHAWVTMTGFDAMDPTLNSNKYEYFGVEFDFDVVRREIVRNKVYGLLDPGLGLNTELMFAIDPALKPVVEAIIAKRRERSHAQLHQD
jgi:hypothetical protein